MRFTDNIVKMKVHSYKGEIIGSVADLVISVKDKYPVVNAVVIKFREINFIGKTPLLEPATNVKLIVPWRNIRFSNGSIHLRHKEEDLETNYLSRNEILVGKNVVDSIITTSKGDSIGRVNDAVIFERNGSLELFGLGVGIIGIVAKLGLEIPLEVIDKGFGRSFAETVVDWKYVKDYHPHKNEISLTVGEEIKAEKQIDWSQSKQINRPKGKKNVPFIFLPWVYIADKLKIKTTNKKKGKL